MSQKAKQNMSEVLNKFMKEMRAEMNNLRQEIDGLKASQASNANEFHIKLDKVEKKLDDLTAMVAEKKPAVKRKSRTSASSTSSKKSNVSSVSDIPLPKSYYTNKQQYFKYEYVVNEDFRNHFLEDENVKNAIDALNEDEKHQKKNKISQLKAESATAYKVVKDIKSLIDYVETKHSEIKNTNKKDNETKSEIIVEDDTNQPKK